MVASRFFTMATSVPPNPAYTTPPNSQGYVEPPQQTQGYIQGAQQTQGYSQAYPQLSPMNSATGTPMDQSPSSPRNAALFSNLPLATRQLRPPKSPMYIPAALRPTEKPSRPAPLTPPRSVHGSTESLDGSDSRRPFSRRSTADSKKKAASVETAEDDLPEVAGPPTREHWKPDADAMICDAPICQKAFSLFERRHHCRHCGLVFCNTHSAYSIPLDQSSEFHPNGTQCRACKHCWDRYREWKAARVSRNNSMDSESTTTLETSIRITAQGEPGKSAVGQRDVVASSAPKDWTWSTF